MLLEDLLSVQVPRHQEIEQSPQLYQPVLNRRPCQNKPMQPPQLLNRFELQCLGVLYEMPLVQNDELQVDIIENTLVLLD